MEQISDLTQVERQGVNAFLKIANDDSKGNVVQAVKNYRTLMSNEYECPPIGVRKHHTFFRDLFVFFRLLIGFSSVPRGW